jgi:WD40 repeat protein
VGLEGAPNLAERDRALQRLLTSLHTSTEQGGQSAVAVAWSPSGRVLAAIPSPSFPSESTASTAVTFYDSATGKTLAVLRPQVNSDISTSSGLILCWSADGSHVLFYSAQLGTITIWGPGMLPRTA